MGYAGGTRPSPTYQDLGDHTEAIQIDYDPAQISYGKLLDVFWASHHPTQPSFSRQYMSIIFYHNEKQRRLAIATKEREAAKRKAVIHTEITPATTFTLAEDYHQKYYLRHREVLMREFRAVYPRPSALVASTAAARVNGYLGGNGSSRQLQGEIDELGLSPAGRQRLLEIVRQPAPIGCR